MAIWGWTLLFYIQVLLNLYIAFYPLFLATSSITSMARM